MTHDKLELYSWGGPSEPHAKRLDMRHRDHTSRTGEAIRFNPTFPNTAFYIPNAWVACVCSVRLNHTSETLSCDIAFRGGFTDSERREEIVPNGSSYWDVKLCLCSLVVSTTNTIWIWCFTCTHTKFKINARIIKSFKNNKSAVSKAVATTVNWECLIIAKVRMEFKCSRQQKNNKTVSFR